MKRRLVHIFSVVIVLMLGVLGACGGNTSDSTKSIETGIVLIGVTDNPGDNITSIEVSTNLIEANVSGENVSGDTGNQSIWQTLIDGPQTFDLIKVAGVEEILGQAELPAGTYNQIRMHVTSVKVTVNGEQKEADVPSGIIRLVRPLTVKAGEKVVATFDFDAAQSVVVKGTGGVIFKPVVKLLVRNADQPFVPANAGSSAQQGSSNTGSGSGTGTGGGQGNGTGPGTGQGSNSSNQNNAPETTSLPSMNQGDPNGFFLNITSPQQPESVVTTSTITISGQTSVDAAVSIGNEFVDPDINGYFSHDVQLENGVNIIDVVASIATGEQYDQVITVIYTP